MRKAIIILFVFVLVFCFVACDMSGGTSSNSSVSETMTIDLGDIKSSSKTIKVGSNTLVSMENLKLEDGVFVDTSMLSRSIERRGGESGSKNIFKTHGGGYMMVPDEKHHGEFRGADLGIVDGVIELGFRVFNNIDDDLAITSEEYPVVKPTDLLEEFYYVNFFDSEYKDLDKSRIVVVGPTMGGFCEFSVVQFGDYEQRKEGILDFSPFPGFGLYLFRAIGGNDGDNAWGNYCYVLNPLKLDNMNSSQTIGNEVAVFDVDIDNGQYYKITVHYDSASDIRRFLGSTNERYYNGETRDQIMIPVVDATSKTITYYLGAVDRPFLFTVDLSGADDNAEFTFTCEASDQASFPGFVDIFHEISAEPYAVRVPEGSVGNYLTVALKITEKGYINIEQCDLFTYPIGNYLLGKGSKGGWGNGTTLYDNTTVTGYLVFDCTNKTVNDELFIFTKGGIPFVGCPHMVWDAETERYKCADGTCDETYFYYDMFRFQKTSFDGWMVATLDGHELSVKRLMNARLDDFLLNNSENSHGDDGEFATLISSSSDHNQRVQVSVKEMKTKNNLVTEFTGDVFINVESKGLNNKIYKNVVFTSTGHHWNVSGDKATCAICEETRNVTSVMVDKGQAITLNVSGLAEGDKLIIKVPVLDYEQDVVNGNYNLPALPSSATAYLISPTSGSNVGYTKSGSTYNITVSY